MTERKVLIKDLNARRDSEKRCLGNLYKGGHRRATYKEAPLRYTSVESHAAALGKVVDVGCYSRQWKA